VQRFAVERHVLEPFSESELRFLPEIIATAGKAVCEMISSGIETAMNKYNGLVNNNII